MAGIAKEKGPYAVDAVAEIRHRPDRSPRQPARPVADGFRPGSGGTGRENADGEHSPPHEPRPRGTLLVGGNQGKVTSLISQFMKVGGTGD
jgi:hypothetical protein